MNTIEVMKKYYRPRCMFDCKKCSNWLDKEYNITMLGTIPTRGCKCLLNCKKSKRLEIERVESLILEIYCLNYKEENKK